MSSPEEPEGFIPAGDPRFEPPPAGEPIPKPPPAGATDAGLDGVDVTDEYREAAARGLLTGVAKTLWYAVEAKARSYLGTYPPGRKRENVNDFTIAYYGNRTVAAWCFIFVWYVLNSLGLAGLIGGKKAYVPYIRQISGVHIGQSGVKVGAICAVNNFNHIGFCVRVGGGTFDLLSGNSTSGSSSDAITVKRYSTSYIAAYVNLKYPDVAPEPKPASDKDDVVVMVIASCPCTARTSPPARRPPSHPGDFVIIKAPCPDPSPGVRRGALRPSPRGPTVASRSAATAAAARPVVVIDDPVAAPPATVLVDHRVARNGVLRRHGRRLRARRLAGAEHGHGRPREGQTGDRHCHPPRNTHGRYPL